MMAPRMAGLMCCHSSPSLLVTEMKSEPRNTPVTPSTPNRRCASGEVVASDLSRKSTVPSPNTVLPGMNLSVAGLGVGSVWMNMGGAFLRSDLAGLGIILVDGAEQVKMPAAHPAVLPSPAGVGLGLLAYVCKGKALVLLPSPSLVLLARLVQALAAQAVEADL